VLGHLNWLMFRTHPSYSPPWNVHYHRTRIGHEQRVEESGVSFYLNNRMLKATESNQEDMYNITGSTILLGLESIDNSMFSRLL